MAFRSASSNTTGANNITVAVPSGVVAGDVIVLYCISDAAENQTVTPSGFTLLPAGVLVTTVDGSGFKAWAKVAGASESAFTLDNTAGANGGGIVGGALAFSGRDGTAFLAALSTYTTGVRNLNVGGGAIDSSTASPVNVDATGLTAPAGADLVWLGAADVNTSLDVTFGAPSGYTLAQDLASGFRNMAAAYKENATAGATGTVHGTGTFASGFSGASAFLLAIPAASSLTYQWRKTTPATTFASDTFASGVAGQDLSARTPSGGGTWAKVGAGTAMISGSSTGVSAHPSSAAEFAPYYHSGSPTSADYRVNVNVLFSSGSAVTPGPAGRISTADQTCYFVRRSSVAWELYKQISGTETQIGSYSGDGYVSGITTRACALEFVGSTINVYIDNTLRISVTDTAITSAGKAGVGGYFANGAESSIALMNFAALNAAITTNISGATSSSYTLPGAALSDDSATFDVVVTNVNGSTTSSAATLLVIQPAYVTSSRRGIGAGSSGR